MKNKTTLLICSALLIVVSLTQRDRLVKKGTTNHQHKKVDIRDRAVLTNSSIEKSKPIKGTMNSVSSQSSNTLTVFEHHHSKILRSNYDEEILNKIYRDQKRVKEVVEVLSNTQSEFSTEQLIQRETAIQFILAALETDPDNTLVYSQAQSLVHSLLGQTYKRSIQKTVNGDVLDLLSAIYHADKTKTLSFVKTNPKYQRYLNYMLALEDSIAKKETL